MQITRYDIEVYCEGADTFFTLQIQCTARLYVRLMSKAELSGTKTYVPCVASHRYIKLDEIDDYISFLQDCWNWRLSEGEHVTLRTKSKRFLTNVSMKDSVRTIHLYKWYNPISSQEDFDEVIETLRFCKKKMEELLIPSSNAVNYTDEDSAEDIL